MSLILPDWPAPEGIIAFTTTRETGENVRIRELAGAITPRIRQVHGTVAVAADRVVGDIEADAIHTRRPGIVCRVITADCLPVLLCHRHGEEIAAIHAGWRGLAAGVVEATLDSLVSDPGHLLAWIGPAISQSCYEVGAEVREAFLQATPSPDREAVAACFLPREGRFLADLVAIARGKLQALGVAEVHGGDYCTYTESDRFHSWRRDGPSAGRMATLICRNSHT